MINRYRILFARTCSFGLEHPEVTNWLATMTGSLSTDPRCAGFRITHHTEHRIHCGRNELANLAIEGDFDYLCFIDGDMHADLRLWNEGVPPEQQPNARPWSKSFLRSSLNFMMTEACGIVAAPAVTGPPAQKLNVFLMRDDGNVSRMSHEEYKATPPSMKQVYAIGTGLMLIDVNVFRKMPKPWFEDVMEDDGRTVRLSQDCAFCAKCNDLGFPVYANLYSPAGHIKYDVFSPPEPVAAA